MHLWFVYRKPGKSTKGTRTKLIIPSFSKLNFTLQNCKVCPGEPQKIGGFIWRNKDGNGNKECEVASGVDGPGKVCFVTFKKVHWKGELPPPLHKGTFCCDLFTQRDLFTFTRMCVERSKKYFSQLSTKCAASALPGNRKRRHYRKILVLSSSPSWGTVRVLLS